MKSRVIVVQCNDGNMFGVNELRKALEEGWIVYRVDTPHMGGASSFAYGCLVYILGERPTAMGVSDEKAAG